MNINSLAKDRSDDFGFWVESAFFLDLDFPGMFPLSSSDRTPDKQQEAAYQDQSIPQGCAPAGAFPCSENNLLQNCKCSHEWHEFLLPRMPELRAAPGGNSGWMILLPDGPGRQISSCSFIF
jgi:hypothetical protein